MKPREVKMFISRAVDRPLEIQPIHIWGPPGIGKSAIPRQVAEEKGIGFVDMRLAQRDPTDLRGIPAVIDGKATWLPPPELPTEYFCRDCMIVLHEVNTVKGKDACPRCGGTDITDRGILFLDEMTSAPPLTQASAYQLTLDRRISEYILPDKWYIIAAGNRMEDRAVVYRMSTALANRFSHVDFEVNLGDFTEWALKNGINTNIVGFLNFRPDLLFDFNPESSERAFPTPRSWEFASNMINIAPKSLLPQLLEGTIGKGPTSEFIAFLKVQDELPNIDKIFAGEDYVPQRNDMRYALVCALVARAKPEKDFDRLLQYSYHLPAEFSALLAMMMVAKDEPAVADCPSWIPWATKNQDILLRRKRSR